MTTIWKKIRIALMVSALCLMACLLINPVQAQAATKKAKVVLEFTDGTQQTWKTGDAKIKLGDKELAYIYFGEYPQTEVTGKKLTKAIKNAKYNKNGVATVKGVKYKRISKDDITFDGTGWSYDHFDWTDKTYAYFKYEPIKWRVLYTNKKTVLLLSEYAIDDQRYNETYTDITWEGCTLRTWLNDDFISSAFNAKEKKLIKKTKLENNDNTFYDVEGGENTKDKVFLLSIDDMLNTEYGFDPGYYAGDINRRCSSTDYAMAMGASSSSSYETVEGKPVSFWWLRSPGDNSRGASSTHIFGYVYTLGDRVNTGSNAVRPALTLNLKSIIG